MQVFAITAVIDAMQRYQTVIVDHQSVNQTDNSLLKNTFQSCLVHTQRN